MNKHFSGEEETCGDNKGQAGYYKNLIFRQKNGASKPVGSTLPFRPHSWSAKTLVKHAGTEKVSLYCSSVTYMRQTI